MPSRVSDRAIPLVFFASGASGLIFEVVWFERCGLVFGNSVVATSLVLSSFMAGLAAGSALVGRFASRIRRHLLWYGALEAIVAVSGIAVTYGVGSLTGMMATLTQLLVGAHWLVNLARLAVAFLVLAIPTSAMGATLPTLVGLWSGDRTTFGHALGRLYGWNTLGAVSGVVATELILIRTFGLAGSGWIAALISLGAASAALWLSRLEQDSPPAVATGTVVDRRPAEEWRLLACAFTAGASLLALEVVWTRFLSLFVVSSTLSMSLVLAVVLSAIGLGGLVGAAVLRGHPDAVRYLPALACVAAGVTATTYGTFRFLATGPWAAEWYRILWFASALSFPTSLVSGVLFTFIAAALGRRVAGEARAAAWMTVANTTGGMVGPPVAVFLLLPALGMERSFFALAAVYLGIALLAIPEGALGFRTARGAVAAVTAAGALIALVLFPFGAMAATYLPRAVREFARDGSRIVATREGPSETAVLMQKTWMETPLFNRLVTNSFSMSGTQLTGKRYMRYFAYWPMLLHATPLRRALVICYGVGVTASAVTDIKSVESIDVVEISRDVVSMSDLIYPPDQRPLGDRRVHLTIEDGRNFLQTTTGRYDLITGEPPPPLTPGTVSLYTREYFQLAHDRLADGGMLTYWLPVARRGEYDIKAIIRAFCDVFRDCSLWNGTPLDWVLIGTHGATGPVRESQFVQAWADPHLQERLSEIGFEQPGQIGATFLGDADYLEQIAGDSRPLTDNYPQRLRPAPSRLSLQRPLDEGRAGDVAFVRQVIDPIRAREAFTHSSFVRRLWPAALIDQTLPFFDQQPTVNRVLLEGANPLRHIDELHRLLTETSLQKLPLWALGSDDVQQQIGARRDDGSYMVPYVRGVLELAARNYAAAADSLADAELRGLRTATSRPLLVYALCLAGKLDAARQLSEGDMPTDPDRRHAWIWIGARFGVGPGARLQPGTKADSSENTRIP
jgi:spermidine synthase